MKELLLPYHGRVELTSRYGYRQLNGETNWHNGVDLVGIDSKIITSPCDGVVGSSQIITDKTNKTWEWGNYVRINYKNYSIYLCHMAERFVSKGEYVASGQPIGFEGNTGYSFGNHCHFEVRLNNSPIDPTPLLGIFNGAGVYENDKEIKYGHDWSEDAIKWAIENGILKGYSDTTTDYKLDNFITREEMIVFLYRFYKNC